MKLYLTKMEKKLQEDFTRIMGPSSARTIQGAMRGHIARNTVRARENEIIQVQL
jgi:hypothetical protein